MKINKESECEIMIMRESTQKKREECDNVIISHFKKFTKKRKKN